MLTATFKTFAANTSMHGVKYISDERNSPKEKKFWAVVLIISTVGCIYMVALLWNNFISKPTRVYTETSQAATDVIPFPAVTICNTNIISKTKLKDFVSELHLQNDDRASVEKAFEALLAFRFKLQVEFEKKDIDILQRILSENRYNVSKVMMSLARTCDEVLVKCSWLGKVTKCRKIFRQSLSSTGYCCSFNYNIKNSLHSNKNSSRKRPLYTLYPGYMMGLSVLLNPHEEAQKISYRLTNGMEVAIHHSDNYPGTRTYRTTLPIGFQTFLQVSGSTWQVSEEVSLLPATKRGCVFPVEKQLRFFREYTQTNCYSECEMLFILHKCGCVPYFYNFGAEPICDPSAIHCLFDIRDRNYSKLECNCPSKCAHIKYNIMSSTTLLVNSGATTWPFMTGTNITNDSTLVTVFFASEAQQIYKRDVVDSTIYLLASFGGIFGLFLGWSFITGAEIIYYFIIRSLFKRILNNSAKRRFQKPTRKPPTFFIYEPRDYLP